MLLKNLGYQFSIWASDRKCLLAQIFFSGPANDCPALNKSRTDIMMAHLQLKIWDVLKIDKFWMSEWLLFNANSAIFQLYYCENKLIFNEMMMRSTVLNQYAELDFSSARSLKQQFVGRHVTLLRHINLILS